MSSARVWSASVVPSLVGPLLSWISSSATMSGDLRLLTMSPASSANFASASPGSRFSTLKVATESSLAAASLATSCSRPSEIVVNGSETSSLKLPKL